jgi:tRNA(fMet)-specific endonuclease VapC
LEELTQIIAVLPLPPEAASIYGTIRAALTARGELIGGNDLWIAAHARLMNLTVVTDNERELRRIPDLKIENWIK